MSFTADNGSQSPTVSALRPIRIHEASRPRIAVMIPCYNEEATIGKVLDDFRHAAPTAAIYVFDNNSSDRTAEVALSRGAHVIPVSRRGKGNVVRAMLSKLNADVYVMADGDDTYRADALNQLMAPVLNGQADMVVGARRDEYSDGAFRPLHQWGNSLFCQLVNKVFGASFQDVLSGYRVFNQRVARSLPVVSSGFEIEAEMTIQCLYYDLTVIEIPVPYGTRPQGSSSKLNTFRDGARILLKVFHLLRAYKPLTFFGSAGLIAFALFAALQVFAPSMGSGPTWPLIATARDLLGTFAVVVVGVGVMLHTINYRVKELHCVMTREGSFSDEY